MLRRTWLWVLVVSVLIMACSAHAQTNRSGRQLQGAWRVISQDGRPVTQPSFYLFTARYYSRMVTVGDNARTPFRDPDPSKARHS
jgi:hypothetical protein